MDNPNPQKMMAHCPLCQAAYSENAVRLVGEKGPARLFHCTCADCGHAVLAVVIEVAGGISSIGLVTDLEVQDAVRFANLPPISSDECISAHKALEEGSRRLCGRLLDKKA
jgi:hypothetical protein